MGELHMYYATYIGCKIKILSPVGFADGYYDIKYFTSYIGWVHLVGGVGEGRGYLPAFKGSIALDLVGPGQNPSVTKSFNFNILEAMKQPLYLLDFSN
jgi:hypothetical protein